MGDCVAASIMGGGRRQSTTQGQESTWSRARCEIEGLGGRGIALTSQARVIVPNRGPRIGRPIGRVVRGARAVL